MSSQPAVAAQPRTPTHSFTLDLARPNLAKLLKEFGLDGYEIERDYDFEAGPQTLSLYAPVEQGEVVPGQTMLDRGATIEGRRLGLASFLATVKAQKSIPVECRGKIAIVCEAVLVGWDGLRCLVYSYWHGGGWVVLVRRVGRDWSDGDRFGRLGK